MESTHSEEECDARFREEGDEVPKGPTSEQEDENASSIILIPSGVEDLRRAAVEAGDGTTTTSSLVLSNLELRSADLRDDYGALLSPTGLRRLSESLLALDLSRNRLDEFPVELCSLENLRTLDVGRNYLRGLPDEVGRLQNLVALSAVSNNFRLRSLPLEQLASLPELEVLDLRFNEKLLRESARRHLESVFASDKLELRLLASTQLTGALEEGTEASKKLSACDRDADDLRSQLEPLSTPQLRKRLQRTFGVVFAVDDETGYNREMIMQRLLSCYEALLGDGQSRSVRHERGIPLREDTLKGLLAEMEAIQWPRTNRERPKVSAEQYMILQRPTCPGLDPGRMPCGKPRREAEKLRRHWGIWEKAAKAMEEVDPEFAARFTALAVTKNFRGSPHIDTLNVGPFYGLSLGTFSPDDGGQICVECSPTLVAHVDTRGRLAKVDGRFPHWVSKYDGTRYSLIFYATRGEVTPQTTAVFEPPPAVLQEAGDNGEQTPWISPPIYEPLDKWDEFAVVG